MDNMDVEIPVKAKKTAAKKAKAENVSIAKKEVVFVCLDPDVPRFELIIDADYRIRGVRNNAGHLLFAVPTEDAERVRKHFHVTTGRLVQA